MTNGPVGPGAERLTFGTDGWRDVIGDRFTFANVGRAAQAYAEHLLERGAESVVVGYDTRFNAGLFARRSAEVLAGNGLRVLLASSFVPTPALSFAVKHARAGGGVMLTASHNPPSYLGFKLKGPYGGTATEDIYRDVSARVEAGGRVADAGGSIEPLDVRAAYFGALAALVDLDALSRLEGSVVHDAMGGAAAGWLADFVRHAGLGLRVDEVRGRPDPMFHGVNPEPIEPNLGVTMERMRRSDALFATATDGDGDRLGLVLPGGAFFNSHQIFALLLDHLDRSGRSGRVVKTFTVSRIVERLAARRGLEVVETPVGFKHIVDAMLEGDVLVGGEESGGIGVAGHIPERDGLANSLLVLEAIASSGVGVAEAFAALEVEADWRHAYDRVDLHLDGNALKDAVTNSLAAPPERFAGRAVTSVETRDGVKLNLGDDAWLLFRASGTEPVLRLYCEAPSDDEVRTTLEAARAYVRALA